MVIASTKTKQRWIRRNLTRFHIKVAYINDPVVEFATSSKLMEPCQGWHLNQDDKILIPNGLYYLQQQTHCIGGWHSLKKSWDILYNLKTKQSAEQLRLGMEHKEMERIAQEKKNDDELRSKAEVLAKSIMIADGTLLQG